MDFYKLLDFETISIDKFIQMFHSNETIKFGAISVFGDSIGKPGDITYSLESVNKIGDHAIALEFRGLRLIIYNPQNIVINEKVIGGSKCSKIEWVDDNVHLVYELFNDKLQIQVIRGEHFFRTMENRDALIIYAW